MQFTLCPAEVSTLVASSLGIDAGIGALLTVTRQLSPERGR